MLTDKRNVLVFFRCSQKCAHIRGKKKYIPRFCASSLFLMVPPCADSNISARIGQVLNPRTGGGDKGREEGWGRQRSEGGVGAGWGERGEGRRYGPDKAGQGSPDCQRVVRLGGGVSHEERPVGCVPQPLVHLLPVKQNVSLTPSLPRAVTTAPQQSQSQRKQ